MKVNKIVIIILSIILAVLLTGCDSGLVSTEVEEVDAFVTRVYYGRFGYFVTVEYGGAKNEWNSQEIYSEYKNCIGKTIKCYMIIRTYESGETTKELVYNQELINN